MPKVSVQIVTWNSLRYIFDCLESLMRQTYRDFSIVIIDNGSEDGTVEFLREQYPTVSILQNFKNNGFTKANNQGIHLAKGQYVLVMNPDVILADDYLENIVNCADQYPEAASFGGKVLKLFSDNTNVEEESNLRKVIKSRIIDSAGLLMYRSRKAANRGEGAIDRGQYERVEEVFGHSGACVLYRKPALDEIMIRNEYYDQDFFAYKEDVDLAWRLRLYGWSAWYTPKAISYHHRRFAATKSGRGLKTVVRSRRSVSPSLRIASFKNHHLMLVKNDQLINILLHLPWFLPRELVLIFYSVFFEFFQWRSLIGFFRQLPSSLIKRRVIMAHKKVGAREIRKWFI